jgi:hypothetical protein
MTEVIRFTVEGIRVRNSAISEVTGSGMVGGSSGAMQVLEVSTNFAKTLQVGQTLQMSLIQSGE